MISNKVLKQSENIKIKCKCNREFITTLNRFMYKNKTQCDVCSGHKYDTRYIKEYLESRNAILIEKEYKNTQQKLKIQCSCGEIFYATFSAVRAKGKTKCNVCSIGRKSQSLTEDEVNEYLHKVGLKLKSKFTKSNQKIEVECPCGNVFYRTFNKIKSSNQTRCPSCTKSMSYVEMYVYNYLTEQNINFRTEYTFKNLKVRHNVCLRFDFAIFDKHDNLLFLIELDGEHHYKLSRRYSAKEDLAKVQKYDQMKNDYCKSNNYKLYRIPYWEFNKIGEKISNVINKEILCQAS